MKRHRYSIGVILLLKLNITCQKGANSEEYTAYTIDYSVEKTPNMPVVESFQTTGKQRPTPKLLRMGHLPANGSMRQQSLAQSC